MNSIVLDSSSLISISKTCLINVLPRLAEKAGFELVIPYRVEEETVERPRSIKQFELNALRIQHSIENGWLKVKKLEAEGRKKSDEFISLANDLFYTDLGALSIIQGGEAETIGLVKESGAKLLAVDERNTRMLVEDIEGLKNYLQKKYGKIRMNEDNAEKMKELVSGINVIRSSEFIAWGFRQKMFEPDIANSLQGLEAALYAVKYSGCSVSEQEIRNFLKESQ
ncbi:MAG: hypothetical protein V1847_02410 [Candidatus Diapherotrites archaeon]